tara:strand:+ start:2298 stop:3467 length:1170 start_codon:yes stop_codon:yes gene_type:complete
MTINKSSGDPLSFENDIAAEFGNGDYSLGQYRRNDPRFTNKNAGNLTNLRLDSGIPVSGEIKFSDFYGKKLNIVVNYYNGGREIRETVGRATLSATHRFKASPANNPTKVVGGFKSIPASTVSNANGNYTLTSTQWRGGKKVIVHVNKEIGGVRVDSSSAGNRNQVSLRTGSWPSGTELQIDVGSSGRIQGSGGKGGNGSGTSGNAQDGSTGRSGLGIEYAATINNSGTIRCGYGGGGGGSGAANDPSDKSTTDFGRGGGGGGGGAGIPAGLGGSKGGGGFNGDPPTNGTDGGNATKDNGGAFGPSNPEEGANAGRGGEGGDLLAAAGNGVKGTQGRPGVGYGPPGEKGNGATDGRAICYRTTAIRNASDLNGNGVGGRSGGQVTVAFI